MKNNKPTLKSLQHELELIKAQKLLDENYQPSSIKNYKDDVDWDEVLEYYKIIIDPNFLKEMKIHPSVKKLFLNFDSQNFLNLESNNLELNYSKFNKYLEKSFSIENLSENLKF